MLLTLDTSTPVRACTAGGSWLIKRETSLVVRSSPTRTISSVLANGADTSAATCQKWMWKFGIQMMWYEKQKNKGLHIKMKYLNGGNITNLFHITIGDSDLFNKTQHTSWQKNLFFILTPIYLLRPALLHKWPIKLCCGEWKIKCWKMKILTQKTTGKWRS